MITYSLWVLSLSRFGQGASTKGTVYPGKLRKYTKEEEGAM